ncbi:cobalt-zinc-cadmium efflux system membrane fusion protein [Tahibacter aquaticus]|uniref:Cobalt-zinc-cadmium efflux system membrane fusion protein n=1 Tax=Tahibacter aquaticus TaxID=520092 RepID=A0A4R6YL06_9GAMM|nr:efflux RND transporter periplasmic adaptor subunit [Tahibacter aquaticus]TDR37719.1 cobalt-zinc-cadmium efflux system membrane fusion protein [Tahibacter aquaticus]
MTRHWILALALAGLSCTVLAEEPKAKSEAPGKEQGEEHAEESPLAINAATQKQLGIATAVAELRTLEEEIKAPGEVKANAYATTLVSPRIPAQIVRRHKKLGDEIKAGETLVSLSSVEVAEAQGAYIVAEREWQRVQALGAEAVSGKRFTESQVARDQARAKLRAYGIGDGEIASLLKQGSARASGEFSLVAPQAGRITSDDFIVGERVEPGKVLFTIVDEATVWVEAQLAPSAAERVVAGAAVRVIAHTQTLPGKVVQLSHRTQEGSRTSPARIEVANDGDLLHTGEFVEAYIATASTTKALAIPTEAIVQLQGQPSVFVAEEPEHFETLSITLGEVRGAWTVVTGGLEPGTTIAVKGAYALKARLLKSALGEGHGH